MTYNTTYATHPGSQRLEQYQLQKLAKDVLDHGKIISIEYHEFSTNMYGQEMQSFRTGSKCITVEGFGFKYYVHLNGLRVSEIIETYTEK